MAAVTKNLAFAITTSTSFENPFIIAKRFSTLDHLTDGRFGWNIVTSYVCCCCKEIKLTRQILAGKRPHSKPLVSPRLLTMTRDTKWPMII
jgi:hypothetical protein